MLASITKVFDYKVLEYLSAPHIKSPGDVWKIPSVYRTIWWQPMISKNKKTRVSTFLKGSRQNFFWAILGLGIWWYQKIPYQILRQKCLEHFFSKLKRKKVMTEIKILFTASYVLKKISTAWIAKISNSWENASAKSTHCWPPFCFGITRTANSCRNPLKRRSEQCTDSGFTQKCTHKV